MAHVGQKLAFGLVRGLRLHAFFPQAVGQSFQLGVLTLLVVVASYQRCGRDQHQHEHGAGQGDDQRVLVQHGLGLFFQEARHARIGRQAQGLHRWAQGLQRQ